MRSIALRPASRTEANSLALATAEVTKRSQRERAAPIYPLHRHTGRLGYDDSLVVHAGDLDYAVGMIRHMAKDSSAHVGWLRDDYRTRREVRQAADTLHLAGVLFQHDRIIDSAEAWNLLSIDTAAKRIYDVLPRSQTPYRRDTGFVATALTPKLSGEVVVLSIDSLDWMHNFGQARRCC